MNTIGIALLFICPAIWCYFLFPKLFWILFCLFLILIVVISSFVFLKEYFENKKVKKHIIQKCVELSYIQLESIKSDFHIDGTLMFNSKTYAWLMFLKYHKPNFFEDCKKEHIGKTYYFIDKKYFLNLFNNNDILQALFIGIIRNEVGKLLKFENSKKTYEDNYIETLIDYRNAQFKVFDNNIGALNLHLEKANLGIGYAKEYIKDFGKALKFLNNYDEKVSIAKSIIDKDEDFKDCKYLKCEFWKIKRKMYTTFYNDFIIDSI